MFAILFVNTSREKPVLTVLEGVTELLTSITEYPPMLCTLKNNLLGEPHSVPCMDFTDLLTGLHIGRLFVPLMRSILGQAEADGCSRKESRKYFEDYLTTVIAGEVPSTPCRELDIALAQLQHYVMKSSFNYNEKYLQCWAASLLKSALLEAGRS